MAANVLKRLTTRYFLLFVIGLAVLFSGLGSARLWDRDEPRNSGCAAEMLARGDWIVPTFNSQLRDHKPVLLYWCQMLSYQLLGRSDWSARIPSAVAAMLTILAVAWLAGRLSRSPLSNNSLAFWSGAALATCLLFVMAGRAATPDSCLIVFSTLGVACLCAGSLKHSSNEVNPSAGVSRESHLGYLPWRWTLLGYTCLGLAALAKGPVGIVLPIAVVFLWRVFNVPTRAAQNPVVHWVRSAWKIMIETRMVVGCAIALAVAAPWYIAVGVATDGEFLRGFFLNHNLDRAVASKEGHTGSILFYPVAILVGTFPWSLWTIPILMWARKNFREYRLAITLAAAWTAVYVGAFTLASTKLPSYVTPCYPGIALLIGGFLNDFAAAARMPTVAWRRAANGLGVFVAAASVTAITLVAFFESMPLVAWAMLGGLCLGAMILVGWYQDTRNRPHSIPVMWLAGAVLFCIALFGLGARQANLYRDDLRSLAWVQSQHPVGPWLSVGVLEPSWVYYLEQSITELDVPNSDATRQQFDETLQQHLSRHGQMKLVIASDAARQLGIETSSDSFYLGEAQTSEQHKNLFRFENVARCKRFLRSGELLMFVCEACDNSPQLARPPLEGTLY